MPLILKKWGVFFILVILIIFSYSSEGEEADINKKSPFSLSKWEVGQYAVYQIVQIEGRGMQDRYEFEIIGKERVGNRDYFWLKITVYEYIRPKRQLVRNLIIKALVPPFDEEKFHKDPAYYIKVGMYPVEALRLIVQFKDFLPYEVRTNFFEVSKDIIENTPYSITPDALGWINFENLRINYIPELISTPAGDFKCYHFSVPVTMEDYSEGIDLWRSDKVPFLGIVKMEFSKTNYNRKKWERIERLRGQINFKNFLFSPGRILLNIIKLMYLKRTPGRDRPDTYTINLLDYGKR